MQAIGTYIRLLYRNGTATGYNFQNFAAGRTITYGGVNYVSAGFGFSGGAFDASASSIAASLLLSLNDLDFSIFADAAEGRWLMQVKTVWLDDTTLAPDFDWTSEIYEVLGIEHDGSRLSVRLGSPLDAVSEQIPKLRLTQSLVGSLPPTGQIPLS